MLTAINPLKVIHKDYDQALKKAKEYIMQNCYWSKSKYYRKIELSSQKLTDAENEVIATAFKIFIHPVIEQFTTSQN